MILTNLTESEAMFVKLTMDEVAQNVFYKETPRESAAAISTKIGEQL